MISEEITKQLNFHSVLGWFGIHRLEKQNSYYGIFSYGEERYILFQTAEGIKCLRISSLKVLTPTEFFLLNVDDRSPFPMDEAIQKIIDLPENRFFAIPEFKVTRESLILPNYLGLRESAENVVEEAEDPRFFQFLNVVESLDLQFFTCREPWSYCGCVYQDSRFINAIRFNLGGRADILTRKPYELLIRKSESSKVEYVSSINYLIDSQLFLEDKNVILFKSFEPYLPVRASFEHDEILFSVGIDDYPQVFQRLLSYLVERGIFSSASINFDRHLQAFCLHVSGYGKKPFTIDQINEPIKQLIRSSVSPGSRAGSNSYESFLFQEGYSFSGDDILHYVNSKANDQVLYLPFRREILEPLFNHYAKLSDKRITMNIL